MKNQTAKFSSDTDATLSISLHKSKKQIRVTGRYHNGEEGAKSRTCSKDFFELAEETPAQAAFEKRIAEAKEKGWVLTEKAERGSVTLPSIPDAPKKAGKPEEVKNTGFRAATGSKR